MDSLEKIKFDYTEQINSLSQVSSRKKSKNCIFVGSGDSYVAGLIEEMFPTIIANVIVLQT